MKFEEPPQPNPSEIPKPEETQLSDQAPEIASVLPVLENTSEADTATRQEADAKKIDELREQLGINRKQLTKV